MITFDNLMLKAFLCDENNFITGARISKIQQPTRREIIFILRNNGQNRQFYINIYPQFYHICFMSDDNFKRRYIEIPQKPPMFCMLLRKYLLNAKISKVVQPENERILELYFETYNEIGDKIYLCLAIELMGKYSNVILYNTDTNLILGCAHNVGADKSQVREVYGQIPYTYPPKQELNDFIPDRYGFLFSFRNSVYPVGTANSIIDDYYSSIIEKIKFKSLKSEYTTIVSSKLNKVLKSLRQMQYQLSKYTTGDRYRHYADLIMANLYNLQDYSSEIEVYDYENDCQIKIKLNKEKTIKDNANDYYKKYNKSKIALNKLRELINVNLQNKDYIESILYSVNIAKNTDELQDLANEIFDLNDNNKNIKQVQNSKKSIVPTYIDEYTQTFIYIGRNNKQNDYIVSKLADDDDLWFHTRNCAGSHVLLKSQSITDELILKCAELAKEFSSASDSSKVGVIYTKRKYLRKPPKANLGYVTYRNEKEIIID